MAEEQTEGGTSPKKVGFEGLNGGGPPVAVAVPAPAPVSVPAPVPLLQGDVHRQVSFRSDLAAIGLFVETE